MGTVHKFQGREKDVIATITGIEIDGYAYHHKGTVQSSRDALKDHIFKSYHLQLLRLSTKGANEEEKVKEQLDTIC